YYVRDAADDGADRRVRHLLPAGDVSGVLAGDRADLPHLLARAGDAIDDAARCSGLGGDRRVLAPVGDRRGARGLGGDRARARAEGAAPDGSPRIRFGRGGPPRACDQRPAWLSSTTWRRSRECPTGGSAPPWRWPRAGRR